MKKNHSVLALSLNLEKMTIRKKYFQFNKYIDNLKNPNDHKIILNSTKNILIIHIMTDLCINALV